MPVAMSEAEAKRPLAHSRAIAGQVGRGTGAAARGTGRFVGGTFRTLWGPLVGIALILGGIGLGMTAATFFESADDSGDREAFRDMLPFVQQLLWMGVILVALGAAVLAVDIYGKHVRDGMRRDRRD